MKIILKNCFNLEDNNNFILFERKTTIGLAMSAIDYFSITLLTNIIFVLTLMKNLSIYNVHILCKNCSVYKK